MSKNEVTLLLLEAMISIYFHNLFKQILKGILVQTWQEFLKFYVILLLTLRFLKIMEVIEKQRAAAEVTLPHCNN